MPKHEALKLATEGMDGVISLPVSVGRVVETLCSNHEKYYTRVSEKFKEKLGVYDKSFYNFVIKLSLNILGVCP